MCTKGELLAVIETPELDQQLAQAKADLATAQSNAALAKVTADRYQGLIGQNAVSQQDTDNAASTLAGQKYRGQLRAGQCTQAGRVAIVRTYRGPVRRRDYRAQSRHRSTGDAGRKHDHTGRRDHHRQQGGLRHLRDPARCACSSMFRRSTRPMRRTELRPRWRCRNIRDGSFEGKLVRTSDAVDPATRTLLAEVDVDNRSGELLPGSYTEVHLNVSSAAPCVDRSRQRADSGAGRTARRRRRCDTPRAHRPSDSGTRLRFDDGDTRRPAAWTAGVMPIRPTR